MDATTIAFGAHSTKATTKPFNKASGAKALPTCCRFKDLKAANIVSDHRQLGRLIAEQGFPPGLLLSPAVRVWDVADVCRWLDARRQQEAD
jgi:hypothetical protein